MTASGGDIQQQFSSAARDVGVGAHDPERALHYLVKMKIIIFLAILHVGSIDADEFFQDKSEIDPKEEFFRHIRLYDSKPFESDEFQNIPLPGGFQLNAEDRLKRSYHVLPSAGLTSYFQIHLSSENFKHKRIKRQTNISNSFQEANDRKSNENVKPMKQGIGKQDLIINDFIRFKRQTSGGRPKRETKLLMEREGEREARGATKEQWIKQPYPVERPTDDNIASASDSVRAPRVHFVTTQRRDRDRDMYHHEEREARGREPPPPPPHHAYPYPPPPYQQPRRYYDPYFQRFDDRDRRYGFDAFDDGRSMLPPPPPQKQRRIIYYATLPEVVRSPHGGEQRYSYRSGYENDRYVAPDYYQQQYRPGTSGPSQKHERPAVAVPAATDQAKTPLYPVKVSTDVNVREPKKNPERRIYSEVDRRFTYKPADANEGTF